LIVSACATQRDIPNDQLALAQSALEDAQRAGGGEYASSVVASASDKLQQARNAISNRDYVSARRLAEEAEADARLAEASAQSAKAQKAAEEVQKSIQTLQQELSNQTSSGSSSVK
jgi:hypothetical protein